MKRLALLLIGIVGLFALAGCGHNVVNYTNGEHFSMGITMSESGYPIFGVKRTNGENLTAAVKDNTLLNVSLENGMDSSGGSTADQAANLTGKTSRLSGMLLYTGNQTTGYDVELAKTIAEKDVAAAKKILAKKNATYVEGKLDENGAFVVTEVKLGETKATADTGKESSAPVQAEIAKE